MEQPTLRDELIAWWTTQAENEINHTIPKVIEYGGTGTAVDLLWMGHELATLTGRTGISDEEATELGIWFYLLGKIARWKAAIAGGRRVSDDTLFDIGVYIRMAQRNRAVGGWPIPDSHH